MVSARNFPPYPDPRPKTIFDVVGAKPPPEITAYSGNGSGINVTGYVVDPTPYYEATGVMVVPLRAGGGMRVKILNALAQGLPIVTTTIGYEGIAVESGRHLLIADTPEAFAEATLRLLENKSLAEELGYNGRRLIQATYDYRTACSPIEPLYQKAVTSRIRGPNKTSFSCIMGTWQNLLYPTNSGSSWRPSCRLSPPNPKAVGHGYPTATR